MKRNSAVSLTEEEVHDLVRRAAAGVPLEKLCKEYGISLSHLYRLWSDSSLSQKLPGPQKDENN